MAQSPGKFHAAAVKQKIRLHGMQLTVTRSNPASTQTLWCIPQPDSVAQAQLDAEGSDNANNAQPHIFCFEGSADVREQDEISYLGSKYVVTRAVPITISGVKVSLHAYGLRES